MLTTFAFGAAMGAGLAYTNTVDYYDNKARALREATAMAEQARAEKSKELTDELFEKWRNALNVEPVTVDRVERVYIKASCPVQADPSTGVDHDSGAGRVELGDAANRGFREVARRAESQYQQCAAQLGAAQALLRVVR